MVELKPERSINSEKAKQLMLLSIATKITPYQSHNILGYSQPSVLQYLRMLKDENILTKDESSHGKRRKTLHHLDYQGKYIRGCVARKIKHILLQGNLKSPLSKITNEKIEETASILANGQIFPEWVEYCFWQKHGIKLIVLRELIWEKSCKDKERPVTPEKARSMVDDYWDNIFSQSCDTRDAVYSMVSDAVERYITEVNLLEAHEMTSHLFGQRGYEEAERNALRTFNQRVSKYSLNKEKDCLKMQKLKERIEKLKSLE